MALGHVTSLGALDPERAKPVIDLLREAEIHIVTLPATDVYLGGRRDVASPRRGLTPVRALNAAGVNVAYSSNNVRNAFTPFGKADPLQIGNLLAHLVQFGTPEHQAEILKMGTANAARAIGIDKDYGLAIGKQADIVILDTRSLPMPCSTSRRGSGSSSAAGSPLSRNTTARSAAAAARPTTTPTPCKK